VPRAVGVLGLSNAPHRLTAMSAGTSRSGRKGVTEQQSSATESQQRPRRMRLDAWVKSAKDIGRLEARRVERCVRYSLLRYGRREEVWRGCAFCGSTHAGLSGASYILWMVGDDIKPMLIDGGVFFLKDQFV